MYSNLQPGLMYTAMPVPLIYDMYTTTVFDKPNIEVKLGKAKKQGQVISRQIYLAENNTPLGVYESLHSLDALADLKKTLPLFFPPPKLPGPGPAGPGPVAQGPGPGPGPGPVAQGPGPGPVAQGPGPVAQGPGPGPAGPGPVAPDIVLPAGQLPWPGLDKTVKDIAARLRIPLVEASQLQLTSAPLLDDEISKLNTASPGIFSGAQRLTTSGNRSDCLIHSFLLALSPAFLNLELSGQNRIASYFRRTVLYNALTADVAAKVLPPRFLLPTELTAARKELPTNLFLSTDHIKYLAWKYQIGVIVGETASRQFNWTMMGGAFVDRRKPRFIILYNPGRGHFEPVFQGIYFIFQQNQFKLFQEITDDNQLQAHKAAVIVELLKIPRNKYTALNDIAPEAASEIITVYAVRMSSTDPRDRLTAQEAAQLANIDIERQRQYAGANAGANAGNRKTRRGQLGRGRQRTRRRKAKI